MNIKKKGAIELSFSVIFAVILIGVFLFVAFFAIKFFLNMQCTVSQAQLVDNIQKVVDRMWQSSGGEQSSFVANIGGFCSVKELCFVNPDFNKPQKGKFVEEYGEISGNYEPGDNMFFYPLKNDEFNHVQIDHLNLDTINPNPYCVNFVDGKINLRLKKSANEILVRIDTSN